MTKCKILFIGGGSAAAANIAVDAMLCSELTGAQITLFDLNIDAANTNKKYLQKAAKALGGDYTITATDNSETAFDSADYVIITISTGGLKSMSFDLDISEKYGIYHSMGDTAGTGGWARRIRNYATFIDIADKVNTFCPKAFVINYTNPMAFTTAVLESRIKNGHIIGLCRGMQENVFAIKEIYNIKDESELSLKYGGLNHFFWITQATYRGKDIIKDLRKKLRKKSLLELLPVSDIDLFNFKNGRAVADELFRITGVMPYFNDIITCEFFSNYITSKKTIRDYKINRITIQHRIKRAQTYTSNLDKMLNTELNPDSLKASGETAINVITAHLTGKKFIGSANTKNVGQISNLPLAIPVETACCIDSNGVNPVHFGRLPQFVDIFCNIHANIIDLTLKGCMQEDKQLLLQALRLEPVCSHLSYNQLCKAADELLDAHRQYIKMRL